MGPSCRSPFCDFNEPKHDGAISSGLGDIFRGGKPRGGRDGKDEGYEYGVNTGTLASIGERKDRYFQTRKSKTMICC